MNAKDLFTEYRKTGDLQIRNKIVEDNLYMVDILIKKFMGKGIEREDLYQVGAMALINAVDRFDPEKGFEFSTFATPTILGELKKYFRDKGWALKVPRRLKETAIAIPAAKEKLTAQLGRTPTPKEVAGYMGKDEDEILEAMESNLAYGAYSLDDLFSADGEREGISLEKFTAIEEDGYSKVEYREILDKVLDGLSDANRFIYKKRFVEELSQAKIAEMLGVSQMTVSRAEKNIRQKIAAEMGT